MRLGDEIQQIGYLIQYGWDLFLLVMHRQRQHIIFGLNLTLSVDVKHARNKLILILNELILILNEYIFTFLKIFHVIGFIFIKRKWLTIDFTYSYHF